MKIAYLIHGTYNSGGTERVLCNKANWLVKHGHEVTIVTTDQRGRPPFFDFDPQIRTIDLGIDFTEANSGSFFKKSLLYVVKQHRYKVRLLQFLKENPCDIVISMFGHELNWLPKLRDGSKKIAEIHASKLFRIQYGRGGLWRLSDRLRSRSDERAVRRYDRFVALTYEDKAYWGNANIAVIPNAASFIPDRTASLDKKRVIAVGRLSQEKGYDRLIDAWKIVHRSHPDWALTFFGSGDLYEQLVDRIEKAGLQQSVTLSAPTARIVDEYLGSSFTVLSSRREGLPMVLLEAMACGVPAVSSPCRCGPRDIIESGLNGLLVEEGDVEGLAAGIVRLIEDEPLRRRLGRNARRTIEERFSEPIVMQQWVELFHRLKKE